MDLQAIKFGLGIAACVIVGIVVLFALYVKLSVASTSKGYKKNTIKVPGDILFPRR